MQKRSTLDKIVSLLEKRFGVITIVFFAVIALMPLIVFSIYAFFSLNFENPISADGILGYIGATLGAVSSLLVSFIALYESKKRYEAENEDAQQKRRDEIRPTITIEFKQEPDVEYFNLKIKNESNNPAWQIHFFDKLICYSLPPNEEKSSKVAFGLHNLDPEIKSIDDFFVYEDDKHHPYPKNLSISLYDKDNNCVFYDFIISEEGGYKLEHSPYYS